MQFDADAVLFAEPTSVSARLIELIAEFDVSESEAAGDDLGISEARGRNHEINVAVGTALALVVEPTSD